MSKSEGQRNEFHRHRVTGYCCPGHSGSKKDRTRWAKQRLRTAFRRALHRGEHDD